MSYVTYTTEALVCGTQNRNTADRSYCLFTKEAGMLYGEARSVREERSRQRYALQDFSYVRISLVKGKQSWKIGSVESVKNYFALADTQEKRASVVAIFRTLRRFIHGEDASPELFSFCIEALELALGSVSARNFFEHCVQIRMLSLLGYVAEEALPPVLLRSNLSELALLEDETLIPQLAFLIKKGVENSQL